MTLPTPRPFRDDPLVAATASIATTPAVGIVVATRAGVIERVFAAAGGTTTGTIAVAVAVNGGADITGGNLTVAAGTGARAASVYELGMLDGVAVSEGDLITFTPSGGAGASIAGAFAAVIR